MTTQQTTQARYLVGQFIQACPKPVHEAKHLKIQMRSEYGHTNWITITPDEWKKIEDILFERLD